MGNDFWIVFQWWGTLFLVGAAAYPLTRRLFHGWFDSGYLFAKAVGMAAVTYIVYLLGIVHIAPFIQLTVWIAMGLVFAAGVLLNKGDKGNRGYKGIIIEEVFFFVFLLFWSWVKAHEPSIRSLEKFMDFGFAKSILDSRFFPAPDMWYAGSPINYYYFGHTVMAVLTRLSGLDLTYTFNLMLATIFAVCFSMSFSIGKQLIRGLGRIREIGGGLLTAFLVTLAGNMQTIYALTQGYDGENVSPFWKLLWPAAEFIRRLPEGLNRYWYANATRFIPYTIHEFPSYSFVVSDVHGHVLSIPFVLLAIALLLHYFIIGGIGGSGKRILQDRESVKQPKHSSFKTRFSDVLTRMSGMLPVMFYGFLCSILLMTNALDGPIYLGLFLLLLFVYNIFFKSFRWKNAAMIVGVVTGVTAVTSLPFMLYFKSFVTGVALNCPPAGLANSKIGPLVFEGVEKCQHSPLWMMWLLWGFFIYCGLFLLIPFVKTIRAKKQIPHTDMVLTVFFVFSILLIIFPEFFYFKDIYPMHFRSNTMFKLGYQAFIMFSIISGYMIVKLFRNKIFFIILIPQLLLVSIFPIFSVRSYFNSLKFYDGINGATWLASQYPDDWAGIQWINDQIRSDQSGKVPVIVEADGDSYTDYDRVSTFTGAPTVVGWSVHEWLWRGSYDIVAPRKEDVRKIYESTDANEAREILAKYNVRYIFVGSLERQKFTSLMESKFAQLGKAVFTSGTTVIYEVN